MTLLFDVMTAYLGPLLEKHDAGKSLVWEELETSYAASKAVLNNHDNYFVTVRIQKRGKNGGIIP